MNAGPGRHRHGHPRTTEYMRALYEPFIRNHDRLT